MKKSFTFNKPSFHPLMIASLLLFTMSFLTPSLMAQRIVEVPSFAVLNTVINGDTTATGARVDDNTIYQLERDGIYEVTSPISLNVKLHLRGEDGEGALPAIFPRQPEGGGNWPQVINTRGDLILEYVYISNQNGAVNRWAGISANGANSRVEIRGSHLEWNRAASVNLQAEGITFIMEDSRVSKHGNRNIYQGNGRLVDVRASYADTVIVRNTTFYYIMDRIVRTQGATIKYLEFDHNTGLHVAGRHGAFQLGTIYTAKITNNMFHNVLFLGNNPGTQEQTQPENDDFYQITIDTVMAAGQDIEIRNNNFAFDPEVEAYWATNDSVSKPQVLTASVIQVIGQDAVADAWFEELVEFTGIPPVPLDFLKGVYTNPLATTQPENMDIDDVGIENIDASYANTYASYTAADRGFPLGDLNHFPELKALWLTGGSVSTEQLSKPEQTMVKVFPNPISSMATFVFELEKPQNVAIDIYNINGQKVASVFDGMANAGLNQIKWDATSDGQTMATGVYIYKMVVDQQHQSGYMVVTR